MGHGCESLVCLCVRRGQPYKLVVRTRPDVWLSCIFTRHSLMGLPTGFAALKWDYFAVLTRAAASAALRELELSPSIPICSRRHKTAGLDGMHNRIITTSPLRPLPSSPHPTTYTAHPTPCVSPHPQGMEFDFTTLCPALQSLWARTVQSMFDEEGELNSNQPSHPFYPIPSHPIPSHPIPSHPIPSHPIPPHPI